MIFMPDFFVYKDPHLFASVEIVNVPCSLVNHFVVNRTTRCNVNFLAHFLKGIL